ncbi:thioredoxin family protein [Heyndrickxia oleronia]|uniref:Thioredoxin family protein n=1 Tax=Heyndrickxia oleronia TaxID=38875 RepID=A0AAW6T375_9BACI|nr:thioredoxin family protein [Heyndrickxia oleronia]MCI1591941.1 thioredoxin family protein [Heyndrickxia oleronia]MCI1612755.1 thioredoxin family protein [Heyndrickxia oleronia]MCI1743987.1 thioredoxin family protein [Heyndrickxia oleronia]MCI1760701.1 thioredoxin family protein [Heyndrickxia oleronia]MCM3237312.1 thioredoxin family protein [Heyndrickxia oleronia]
MKKLTSMEEFETLKDSGKTVFMFSADWCPDCRFIDPFLPEIEADFTEYTFVYVDRDEFIDLCSDLDIFGIPSFIVFKEGNELGRFVSKDRKTKEEIETFLKGL